MNKNDNVKRIEKDPVCFMDVDVNAPAGKYDFKGKTYYFCSLHCLEKFKSNPDHILKAEPSQEKHGASLYTCPMHPEIKQDVFGSCPKCGMALEPLELSLDELDQENPELKDFQKRLKVGVVFTVPLLLIAMGSMSVESVVEKLIASDKQNWVELLLSLPVVLWCGKPIFEKGLDSLKSRHFNMFTLIAFGTLMSFIYSVIATAFPQIFPEYFHVHHGNVGVYFEAAASILCLVLLGQVLELRARGQMSEAVASLMRLSPKTARLIEFDGTEMDVDVSSIMVGHKVRIRPGERIPVDGNVIEGESFVDESVMTGESFAVKKSISDAVKAGTTNQSGMLIIVASHSAKNSLLSHIIKLVAEAQRSRAPIQNLADRISEWFVPSVIISAFVTAILWYVFGPQPSLTYALVNAVSVLIIACPCALGLATPMSVMAATGRGARSGVLIKNAEALEMLERIDTIVFDKTGTLTEGKPQVIEIHRVQEKGFLSDAEFLEHVASLEKNSEHPLARAVVEEAKNRKLELRIKYKSIKVYPGKGIEGREQDKPLYVGNLELLKEKNIDTTEASKISNALRMDGRGVLFVAQENKYVGLIVIEDAIKPSSFEAIRELKKMSIDVVMLTGDHPDTANKIAAKLGIEKVYAGVLPDAKHEVIESLQSEGHFVAMAGDGVNDAPALAKANVGIAMGTGTDVAMKSAQVTLIHGDLRAVCRALHLSKHTMNNIRQNLAFAFGYNALGIPIAAGVLYPWFGILLSPMIASAAMSFSSVSVIMNALRLRRVKL